MRSALALLSLGTLLWAGSALAQGQVGPPNMILCNKTASFSGVSAVTKLVSGASTGKAVFICGWHVTNTAGTGTFTITYGTKTTNECDTANGSILPTTNVTSSAPSSDHIDYASVQTPLNTDLCVTPSAITLSGIVYYSQF
jgi:hypothetical protein